MINLNDTQIQTGERLKYFRDFVLKKTQQQMAEELGFKPSQLSNTEKGKLQLTANLLTSLITTYNVNPSWLLCGEGSIYRGSDLASAEEAFKYLGIDSIVADKIKHTDKYLLRHYLSLPHEDQKILCKMNDSLIGFINIYYSMPMEYAIELLKGLTAMFESFKAGIKQNSEIKPQSNNNP